MNKILTNRNNYFNSCYNNFSLHEVIDKSIKALAESESDGDYLFSEYLKANILSKRLKEGGQSQKKAVIAFFKILEKFNDLTDDNDLLLIALSLRGPGCAISAIPGGLDDEDIKSYLKILSPKFDLDLSDLKKVKYTFFNKAAELIKGSVDKSSQGVLREAYVSTQTAIINEKVKLDLSDYDKYLAEVTEILRLFPDYLVLHIYKAYTAFGFYKKKHLQLDLETIINQYKDLTISIAKFYGLPIDDIDNVDTKWCYFSPARSAFAIVLKQYLEIKKLRENFNQEYNPISYDVLGGILIASYE